MKKVALGKWAEIKICCNLNNTNRKFPRTKNSKIKTVKDTMI